jgi:P4 family phage/plasmid primase-like protien
MTSPMEVIEQEAGLLARGRSAAIEDADGDPLLSIDHDDGDDAIHDEAEIAEPPRFKRGDQVELAVVLLDTLGPRDDLIFDEGALYRYADDCGFFGAVDTASKSKILQACAGSTVAAGRGKVKPLRVKASDVHGAIELAHHQVTSAGFFASGRPGLVFTNGFLCIDASGAVLVPHSREHRARFSFPFGLEASPPTRRFRAFLAEAFLGDADAREKILFLQEFFGACLVGRATQYQVSVVLAGDGANAKSKLIEIVRESMPPGTVAAVPPQDWDQEYRRAMLAGKWLNMVSELPEADIIASESVKAMITGDAMVARPIREAPFTFVPKAGHLFAANRLPGATDMTDGFWRRFRVVRFNRKFEGAAANPHIATEILSNERPGVVLWMVEGAVRLAQQGGYTVPPSAIAERDDWRKQANPVALFVEECTRELEFTGQGTSSAALYVQYQGWSERNGHRAMSSTKFGMRMRELGKPSEKRRDGWWYPLLLAERYHR